ncbi:MAG: hypothetical protein JSS66_12775 [Armatimonadetes bacterium]|nr:hypothetical protein [Armatimonadota bacterium]
MGDPGFNVEAYEMAQEAVTLMKSAIIRVLLEHPDGLRNSEIGRLLGVNADFIEGNDGWFQYTVLKIMELDRTVEQKKPRGPWTLRSGGKESKATLG